MRQILFFFAFTFFSHLPAEIIETNCFETIIQYAEPSTLLILDVDNTLITPVQELGSNQWFLHRIEWYEEQGYPYREALELTLPEWEAVQNITESIAVEKTTPQLIQTLQNKGYSVIGLTTRGLALATRTLYQLKKIEIDLSKTAITQEDVPLLNPHAILFRKGILFTAGTDKGEALMKLFKKLQYTPEKIVFINDMKAHLVQVEKHCKTKGIPFVGLRYGYLDEKVEKFRPDIAEYQFNCFSKILSDQEAVRFLKGGENG